MHKFVGTTRLGLAPYRSLNLKDIKKGQKVVHGKGSVQKNILEALYLGERSRASRLLLEFGHGRSTLNANDFLYILQQCARLPDPLFLMETWKLMEEKEITINRECYYFAIQTLCRGGYLNEACAQMHNISYVNQCLDLMDNQIVGKNELTYIQLLKIAVLQQNLSAVHEIWRECTKHYNPSILCLQRFIWSFSKLRDLESANLILQKMIDISSQRDFIVYINADGNLHSLRLDIPAPCKGNLSLLRSSPGKESNCKLGRSGVGTTKGHVYGISKSAKRTQKCFAAMKLLRKSFNDVIHACASMQNDVLAEKLLYQMQDIGLEPSRDTYSAFTMAVLSVRGVHDAIEVIKLMDKKNMRPYDSTLVCLSARCSRSLKLDLAESFLDKVSSFEGPYPFNALLEACDALDLPERAIQTLVKMKKSGIQPDIRTYELLLSLFGCGNRLITEDDLVLQTDVSKRIHAIDMDMMMNGIHHSQLSLMNLLKALGGMRLIKEMIQYLQAAENQYPHYQTCLGTNHYNTVLHSLVRAKEASMAIAIFEGMKSCGVPFDAATYTIMVDCCTIINNLKSASTLVSMMIRDGFIPQIYIYTSFIKILVAAEEFGEAFELLKKGISEGIQPDALLYNRILQKASEKGRIDVIEMFVEQMHRDRVQPNSSICRNIFLAYADRRFYKTAMEALQVLCMRMISVDESVLDKRRAMYENLILKEDTEEDSERKIIELLFNEEEYSSRDDLSIAMLMLRWCAMLGFPVSWSPNHSPWAKRLSINYDLLTQTSPDRSTGRYPWSDVRSRR
ncbi:unnamed protein product [Cuscuta epithymum]|uniref:Pentatricopeptide repeat-containing protein n=2 Tax=Cuscuta epithymum TaxID=186058 RepID=A0AAV0CRA6_9ASTE|nr:unnamed protein product [Cuscuta epithymum]CAH9130725.1 unnamed protein product [Cuscuta epithymum]